LYTWQYIQYYLFAQAIHVKQQEQENNKLMAWLKKIGLAGFLFFLIKGLVWIAIFMGIGQCF